MSKEVALEYGNKEMADNLPSFKEFEEKVFNTLANESVKKIIFDIRYNGGGNSSQGTAFIEKLAKFLEANTTIKTYVVLGKATFSSAILNAMDFKRLTNAIFVGEETGGKPNHFGEVRNFQLPTSQLQVSYSTEYFKRTDKNENTITPDVKIEMSFSDFTKGIDPVYEWIKKQ
jgi:C-terminal processing protease CtpA/Prc